MGKEKADQGANSRKQYRDSEFHFRIWKPGPGFVVTGEELKSQKKTIRQKTIPTRNETIRDRGDFELLLTWDIERIA